MSEITILTKPLHGSQKKLESKADRTIVEIEVVPNFELKQLLLSYGNGIEVISPLGYREEIKSNIESMMNNYIKLSKE